MQPHVPSPGDLIVVDESYWSPLESGGKLRVCEPACWFDDGKHLVVAPRKLVTTFWGPDFGPPDGRKPQRMRTSGGPFRVLSLAQLPPLERLGMLTDTFWHWHDRPHAGGGVDYNREVTLWRLARLEKDRLVETTSPSAPSASKRSRRDVHPIVRQIIDRDCHVGLSDRQVIRHVISRLRNGFQTFRTLAPASRRQLMDDCVRQHRANQDLYREVMDGYSRKREDPNLLTRYPPHLTGSQIVSLMRRFGMTIDRLAFRLGTSQKRVREIRGQGLAESLAVRDWLEAISGDDPGPLPERFRVDHIAQEESCQWCGYPLEVGDHGYLYLNDVFCSQHCARKSRGW